MALPSIPSDDKKMAKSEHPFVSERERLKTLSTVIQQMLVVVGATFVVQTKSLIKDHPYFYGLTYLCAIVLFMGLFTFIIQQPPDNKSLFECVFLMVIIATMTVLIALVTKIWIGIGSAIIWTAGIYFIVVGSKGEFAKQYEEYVQPIAETWVFKFIYYMIAVPIWVTIYIFWVIRICATFILAYGTSNYGTFIMSPTYIPIERRPNV